MAQLHKFLTIDTVLGPAVNKNARDPLMLTRLTGQEGISMPFLYELTMARSFGPGDDFDETGPQLLVGTMARVGILKSQNPDIYTYRTGMFATFERSGFTNPGGLQNKFATYKGTLVPAFMMLGRETVFRIFEAKNVVTIINDVLKDMGARFPDFLFDSNGLKVQDFPNMEYCVQFGESTFAFLTRLMERFGIFYTFDAVPGDEPPDTPVLSDPDIPGGNVIMRASNVRMVFGKVPAAPAHNRQCDIARLKLTNDDPNDRTIAEFQRRHAPVARKLFFGNFTRCCRPAHSKRRRTCTRIRYVAVKSIGRRFLSDRGISRPFSGRSEPVLCRRSLAIPVLDGTVAGRGGTSRNDFGQNQESDFPCGPRLYYRGR